MSPTTVCWTGSQVIGFGRLPVVTEGLLGSFSSLPWGRLLSLPARPARLVDLNRGQGSAQGNP
jgi:hypothetical protein